MTQTVTSLNLVHNGMYTITIDSIPDIPDSPASFETVRITSSSEYVSMDADYYANRVWYAVPIGNWSLCSSLIMNQTTDTHSYSILENDDTWGFSETVDWEGCCGMHIQYVTTMFSKIDGVLQQYRNELSGIDDFNETIFVIRTAQDQTSLIIIATLSLSGVFIIVILLIWKQRTSMKK